jgi:hypothetical protein
MTCPHFIGLMVPEACQEKPVTFPAQAEFLRGGLLAPPRVLGGVLAGAAGWLEEEIKERKVIAGPSFLSAATLAFPLKR